MLLKRLELQGFKSFANRAVFELEPGISILVGPNGSGKSNVADGVRWVLGEQSARVLRGKKAEEVIFVGSAGRHPLGMAEVGMVLDNSERRLHLDFAEVRLSRRLYRSGESEYLINGSRVRRKDLVALLLEVGLHTEGYTVIGQGAVEELVVQRPEERRAVLEHAADISRHQVRLADARSKFVATDQNLTRCKDLIAELEPHSRRLRVQAEKAERYASRRAELAALARAYYGRALAEQTAAAHLADQHLGSVTTEVEQVERQIEQREQQRQALRQRLVTLDASLTELRGRQDSLHRERESGLAQLASGRQRVGFLQARAESLSAEADRIESHRVELGSSEQSSPGPTGEGSLAARRLELQRHESVAERLAAELRAARQTLDAARNEQAAVRGKQAQLAREADSIRQQAVRAEQAVAEARTRRAELQARREDADRQLEQVGRELAAASVRQQAYSAEAEVAQAERQAARGRLRELREAEQRFRHDVEVARAALAALEAETIPLRAPASVSDESATPLAATLRIPEHYEQAVAAALGEWAQALLLESDELAQARLAWNGSGRALFLVSDSRSMTAGCDYKRFVNRLRELLGDLAYDLAAEVVHREPALSPSSLGPLLYTVLVADLATGSAVRERLNRLADFPWQVVTQAGQVVTSFGGWVRGSETAAERLVSARRRLGEAQMRLDRLEPLLQQAAQERLSVERSIGTIESRLREVQDRALTIETELRLHKRRRDELSGSLRRLDEQLRGLSPADTPTQRAVSEPAFENQQAELSRRLEVLAQQEREAANGIHRLQASWEQAWAERESIRRVVDQFLADERAQRERLAERSREQERFRRDRDRAREAARQALEELAPMGDALDTLQEQMADLARRIAMDDERVATLSDERSRLQSRLDGVESELSGLRAMQTLLHPSREQALVARQQAADQLARLQAEAEAVTEEWGLGGEVLVQLRLLHPVSPTAEPAAKADEAHLLERELDLVSTRRRLVALQRELRAVGAVGESVLEEYREVQGRLEFLTTQSRDLIAAMQELNGVVDDLESLMREGFSAAFDRVNGAFAQTFATLFGGGTAQLVLTDPDDPLRTGVEIVAQPPGKRLQNLMSLSGGERALTSTALIFALLAINPLPFCVLDEVDAALDEPNARRFAALLREYAERTQFIVITHNRATMETARALYGISMGGDGVTTVASLMPSEALAHSRNGRG